VCSVSGNNSTCGAYDYPGITNSNGFNTYVTPNCWADPGCSSLLTATGPGNASITQTEPDGNTSVKTYPDVQQLTNDWTGGAGGCGSSCWNGSGPMRDTPLAALTTLSSSYAESMPRTAGTDAQAAWDIWLSGNGTGHPGEVMVWVDNVNRGNGGATLKAANVMIGGQSWDLYEFGSGEAIWSLNGTGGSGTYAQKDHGTVDLLGLLKWMVANGYEAPATAVGQIDFGWEVCSTGGVPGTFSVSAYTLSMAS
jgi:hypothetical protein